MAEAETRTSFNAKAGDVISVLLSGDAMSSGIAYFYIRYVGASSVTNMGVITYGIEKTFTLTNDIDQVSIYISGGLTPGKEIILALNNTSYGLYKKINDTAQTVAQNIININNIDERLDRVENDIHGEMYEFNVNFKAGYTYIGIDDCNFNFSAFPTDKIIFTISGDAVNDSTNIRLYSQTTDGGNFTIKKSYKNGETVNLEYNFIEQIYGIGFFISGLTSMSTASIITINIELKSLDIPNYYKNYLQTKINRINELALTCVGNGDLFEFITDEHWELNQKNSTKITKILNDKCYFNRVFSGGDTADVVSKEFCDALRDNYTHNIHHVIGNHDLFDDSDGNITYYYMDTYNDNQIGSAIDHYYYVDNKQQKIRYIVLAAYANENGSLVQAYTTDQLNWMTNVALDIPNGWSIVVFTHDAMPTSNGWSDFKSALDTAKNTDGKDVIAIISGHAHYDTICHTEGGIPIIVTTCDKSGAWIDGQQVDREPWLTQYRIPGTISEQAFDMIFIDKTNRVITCVRIGALAMNNVDKWHNDTDFTYEGTLEERTVNY